MARIFNFAAGPAALPEPVLAQAASEMLDWHGSGMSVMEMSHRGKDFIGIAQAAEADLRQLLAIPANYKVLFLQGGGALQFAAVPMNLLRGKKSADYVNTGEWSKKAIKEAKRYCAVNVAASSEDQNFSYAPKQAAWKLDPQAAYVHICSNETIGGVEFHWIPETGGVPLVADMSSHILSRPVDVSKYGLIYAGAQKNIGPAGLTIVIVRDDLMGQALPATPSVLDYKAQAEADSMLNTPATYGIYVAGLVFQWLKGLGGLPKMAEINRAKAQLLYGFLDQTEFFYSPVARDDRSLMNVPFRLRNESLNDEFLKQAKARGLVELKGHRSVGGMRASIYNAMPLAGVQALVDFMREFQSRGMAETLKVLTLNNIAPVGLKRLPAGRYEVGPQVGNPDAVLVRSQDMHSMQIAATVKAVARAGAGTNNIPVKQLSARGVPVFNAPGANANAVKELVIAGMLIAARNLLPATRFVAGLAGDDALIDKQVEEGKKEFAGLELPQHTLGVIGLGKVGSLVADAAIKLGMNVLGYDPHITVDAAWSLPSQVKKGNSVEEVLKASDFVTLHVPLGDATRNLVSRERIKLLKSGAILLNFSRDGIVDNDAVLEALADRRLKCYVCDFPAQKLAGQPGVIALPHLGASTREAEENCAIMVVDQLRDYLEHGNIQNAVNFPDVVMPRESPFRVGIANANVPNMLGQISTAMADSGLNIHNMLNKSRAEMAYTLVDVDSAVPPRVVERVAAIKGVLAVRYLPLESR